MAEMLRASKRIVIISERVNRYHFRALIDGIDLSAFEPNPILLWLHNRAFGRKDEFFLPLGNVIELKKETLPDVGYCLTGLPVFDPTDDFAVSIYNKYENGTLRMASAGLIPVEWSEDVELLLPAQRGATLVKSILEEVSIVDIGADPNAHQIALYNENHELIKLSLDGNNAEIPLIQNPIINNEMKKIELSAESASKILGLKETDTPEAYEQKIKEVVQLSASQKTEIENLTREKSEAEQKAKDAEQKLSENEATANAEKIELMVQGAVDARKITAEDKPKYIKLASGDFETTKEILDAKTATPTAREILTSGNSSLQDDGLVELCKKSYNELFQSGDLPKIKLNAPAEYARIYKAKFGREPK